MAGPQPNGRNSEGVVAIQHPRSDFPQQGWQGKAANSGVYYEASEGFGWFSETQSYRSTDKSIKHGRYNRSNIRAFYETQPARVYKATGTFYEAYTGYGWYSESQSFRPNEQGIAYGKRRGPKWDFYQSQPLNVYTSTLSAVYDPAINDWEIPSFRTTGHPSRLFENWDQDDQSFDFITFAAGFDPATLNWTIDTSRMLAGPVTRVRRDTPVDSSWIFPNLPAIFDPSAQIWVIQSHRPAYRVRYAWHAYTQTWTPYLLLKPWLFRNHTRTLGAGFQNGVDT